MTAALAEPLSLAALTDADLERMLLAAWDAMDDLAAARLSAEVTRRDEAGKAERAEQARRAGRSRRQRAAVAARQSEWWEQAHGQYLRADAGCRGNLLSRAGQRAGITEMRLWSVSEREFGRLASEELRDWMEAQPGGRLTFGRWLRGTSRAAAERAWRDDMDWRPASIPAAAAPPVPEPAPAAAAAADDGGRALRAQRAAERSERAAALAQRMRRLAAAPAVITAAPGAGAAERSATMKRTCEHVERWAPGSGKAPCGDCPRRAGHAPAAGQALAPAAAPGAEIAVRPARVIARARPEIDGDEVLRFARAFLGRFGYWPSESALTAATLWAAHAHARDGAGVLVWDATPRLFLLSSEPGSGKSTLLELVGRLCPAVNGLDVEPSEAGVAHTVGREHATLLLDEGDILFGSGKRKASIRAILNAGYTRNGTWLRVRGGGADRVPVFGAAAIAALDSIESDTGDSLAALMSRGVKIRVRRCPDDIDLPRLGRREAAAAGQISAMLAAWTGERLADLQNAGETVQAPAGVRNRAEQIWRPLLAVAEVAGGDWPEAAAQACEELMMSAPAEEETPAEEDLSGLRDLVASWA